MVSRRKVEEQTVKGKGLPLDLLRMWHEKVEIWILGQAGIEFPEDDGEIASIIREG